MPPCAQVQNCCLRDTAECLDPLLAVWRAQPAPVPLAPPPAACRTIVEALLCNYSLKLQESTGQVGVGGPGRLWRMGLTPPLRHGSVG